MFDYLIHISINEVDMCYKVVSMCNFNKNDRERKNY